MTPDVYIACPVRTAVGRRGGGFSDVHPVDLAGETLRCLIERSGIDPGTVDDVMFGCIENVGPQSADIARTSWLAAGFPEHVPGVTVDRRCGSSQQALQFAAATIMAGFGDLLVVGGVQHMTAIPIGASYQAGHQYGFDDPLAGSSMWQDRYGSKMFTQLEAADLIAERWGFSREDLEDYSGESHERALRAQEAGDFADEIVPVAGVSRDEVPRKPDREKMASLEPLRPGGTNTAATSSPISDGAAALILASAEAIERHDLRPVARVRYASVRGDDPKLMLTAPIPATREALARTGLSLDDFDAIEINEAFASVVLAWLTDLGPRDRSRVNPNGGAIGLGHPIGATGVKLMTGLVHHLHRSGGTLGLQVMCEGGGQANVTIVERL